MRSFLFSRRASRGNALFLILIAVALFAALAYAVTQSGRGGSGGVGREQATLHAARILQVATGARNAVTRMMLINGCTDTQLSFHHASAPYAATYVNAAAPADFSCHLYNSAGGAVVYEPSSKQWFDTGFTDSESSYYLYTTPGCIVGIGTSGGGSCVSSGVELVFSLLFVRRDICVAINNMLGIVNPGGNPPDDNFSAIQNFSEFDGDYTFTAVQLDTAVTNGHPAACIGDDTGAPGGYVFYMALLER